MAVQAYPIVDTIFDQLANLEDQLERRTDELAQARQRIYQLESRQLEPNWSQPPKSSTTELRLLWNAINQTDSSIIITDKDGRIEYVNPNFTRVTGYTLPEVFGKNPSILKSGHTLPEDYAQMWQTLSAGFRWTGEFYNKKKNGELFYEHAVIVPVTDDDEQITHYVAIQRDITHERAAEQALRESELRFRTLVNAMDDMVFTLDRTGDITGVYGRWLENNNLTAEMFIGKHGGEIVGHDNNAALEALLERALAGQSVMYDWASGGQAIQFSLSPIFDERGFVFGVVGIGRDITPFKLVERQLRESDAFARATVDALSAQISILDENGAIISVNKAWMESLEASHADVSKSGVGANYLSVLREVDPMSEDVETARAVLNGIEAVIRGDATDFSLEYTCNFPAEPRWYRVRVTPFSTHDPVRVVVSHEDVTDIVLARNMLAAYNTRMEALVNERTAQLQRLNERMNAVLNNVSNPVLLVNAEGKIDTTNPAFDRKLGYQADELYGQPLWTIIADDRRQQIIDQFYALRGQPGSAPLQTQVITRHGQQLDIELSMSLITGNDDYIVCTLYDISHLKELERVKDEFVSMVSHELRTPITSMMLSSSTMLRFFHRLSDEQKVQKLTQINQQSLLLSELVTSILDIARLDGRGAKRSQDRVDLAQALNEVVAELNVQIEEKQQQLELEVVNGLTEVTGEHSDMVRMWRNLISNAVKYTPEGGRIRARLFGAGTPNTNCTEDWSAYNGNVPSDLMSGRYIVGMVEDNGHGIDEKDMPYIFQRFYRGWAAGTNITGTGLGLHYVRDLLKVYGGNIAVKSALGAGSTFIFWLPIERKGEMVND